MLIEVKRRIKTKETTISNVYVDGKLVSYMLEDCDRNLDSKMSLEVIKGLKQYGNTAIPFGTYEVIFDYSNRFKKLMPHVLSVRGFEGIRIHAGNTEADTLGCLLPCTTYKDDLGIGSKKAFDIIEGLMVKAIRNHEKVYISISNL